MVARLLIVTDRNEFKPLEKSYQATGKKTLPSFFFNLWSGFFFLILPEKGKLTVLSRINFTRRQWNNIAFPTLNSAKFWLRLSLFLWKITKVFHDENFLYSQFFVSIKISSCVTQSGLLACDVATFHSISFKQNWNPSIASRLYLILH